MVVDDILKQARQSQESSGAKDQAEELQKLRRQVEMQQQSIAALLAGAPERAAEFASGYPPRAELANVSSDPVVNESAPPPPRRSSTSDFLPSSAGPSPSAPSGHDGFTFSSPETLPPRPNSNL